MTNYASEFIIPNGIYALSHSVGPLPKAAKVALERHYFEPWQAEGGDAWPSWLAQISAFNRNIAQLVNAKESEVCPQSNLASGFSSFLSAIAKRPETRQQRVVVMHEDAFASMGFVVTGLAHSYQLELVLVKGAANNIEAWREICEKHDVLACLITHVHSNTSIKSDIPTIVDAIREFTPYICVDVAQSIGIVPVDFANWQVEAIFGSCVKWLCGGSGAGFMVVNANIVTTLQADLLGWFSHENPFEFDMTHYKNAKDAKRFWGGTPSVAPYVLANASIEVLKKISYQYLVTHNYSLKQTLINKLSEECLAHSAYAFLNQSEISKATGGSLCIQAANTSITIKKLKHHHVRFDQRNGLFRISLHVMNTPEEAEIIAACFNLNETI
ncbi:aminotransferase class V-fold PLP-dependent enzyme [Glaciecola petra]|uniref:Aminotransferase class V-fold PLP-dependent enzyme n=1 Tax=Glaciecola petra TaxID=3075602 RepID=A0ABU2ZS04_9ALTE|nr:aminotransferase class V-fold PLP-dependent enzyme [Aestuariibacter sp. P117]MDT0594379.1 aminotransferase class V-fold PLP-dependent enzyme [Aestuariibacter sp. P117]